MNLVKIALLSFIVPVASVAIPALGETVPAEKPAQKQPAKMTELPVSGLPTTWIQGEPVTKWEKDRLYVFEFWATWCGPCIKAMPHVEAINEKIKASGIDAQIVGINVFDRVPAEKLKKFLEKQRVHITYTMGVDTEDSRATQKNWLTPLGVSGIPHAIVVKSGKILWQGHPESLSFDSVKAMSSSDFSRETQLASARKKAEEKTWSESEFSRIRNLFLTEKYVEASDARKVYIADSRASLAQKIDSFVEAANIFYARERYAEFNDELAALSSAFPRERQAQFEVIRLVLDSDDFPGKATSLELAESCARQLIALDVADKNPQSLPFELLSRILEIRANLTGTLDATLYSTAIDAQRKAVEYSSLSKSLSRVKEKIGENVKPAFDKTLLADKPKESSKIRISGDAVPATNAASTEFLGLLKSLKWAQGGAPEFLPANKTIFIEIWNPQTSSGIVSGMMRSRVPARWFREKAGSAPVQIFAIVPVAEDAQGLADVKKALEKPFYKTSVPVGVIENELFWNVFMKPNKLTHTPAGFAVRNGEIIWAGNPQDAPSWIFETALDGNYNNAEGVSARELEAKKQKEVFAAFSEIRKLYAQNKPDEAKSVLKKWMPEFQKSAGLSALVCEVRMGEPFSKKDYVGVGKLSEELLRNFPEDNFVGERQLKILTSNPELKEATLPVCEKAARQMIRTKRNDAKYASVCLRILSEICLEQGKFPEALGAAQEAVENSPENLRLKSLENK